MNLSGKWGFPYSLLKGTESLMSTYPSGEDVLHPRPQLFGRRPDFKVPSKADIRASLVAQWLRVCLPMQGTRVRALVWEDPTCRGATGPMSHNY